MKKLWLIIFALVAVTAIFANGVIANRGTGQANNSRYEVIAYQENFESGGTGWTHVDGSIAAVNWHIYDAGAPQANVWWMGDPALATGANIGGYYDRSYLVLDTPQILVPTVNPTLTFKMKYNVEALGGTYPTGYNGWDTCNIRISTNNGVTWTPITGTPAYNSTSSYAFGYQHGEGLNVPGWGGNSNGWQNASFNLSTYAGQNVKIRFACASDPEYSTGDNAALFGMMVDDIALGAYTNNGVNDGQMTWTNMVPVGGDLWHIGTPAGAPSPTHAYVCQNASNSFDMNMMNYLISPPIPLPASGDIRCDFKVNFNFTDPEVYPDADCFGWEVSVNNGITWNSMSNPYGTPGGDNFIFATDTAGWVSMLEYSTLDGYISEYHGQTAQFRWFLNSDNDVPTGLGLMIDDFVIYNDIFIAEPFNLEATVAGSNVELAWQAPGSGGNGEPGWLHYDGENNPDGGIGLAENGGTFQAAAKWTPSGANSIAPWVGMNITQIKIFVHETSPTYKVRIYTGGAGTMVYEQPVTNVVADAWNTVTLTTPYTIPSETYVWVGYEVTQIAGIYPAGMDAGPALQGFGDMINTGGSWSSISANSETIDANWNIQAYVADAAGNPVLIGYNPERNDREVTAYKVYRDAVQIQEVLPSVLTYTDQNVSGGLHTYHVTAMYGANESLPSNVVTSFVLPTGHVDLAYSDGSMELGYTLGQSRQMAVKFTHNYSSTLKYAKVYMATMGTSPLLVRVYDDNGENGIPGTPLVNSISYPVTSFVEGWNYIPVPAPPVVIPDGHFYLAIVEYANASQIGLDTSTTGHSYKKMGSTAAWEPVVEGEVMIEAIVENGVAGDDDLQIPIKLAVNNFPNPFNPNTSIKYDVPNEGAATLTVFNVKGQAVRTLLNSKVKAGRYSIEWNGTDDNGNACASGVYFYRLSSNNHSVTQKMLLSK